MAILTNRFHFIHRVRSSQLINTLVLPYGSLHAAVMERDKISELLLSVYDAEKSEQILSCLQGDTDQDPSSNSHSNHDSPLIRSYGSLDHFVLIYDRWVKAQAQPFLSCKPIDPSASLGNTVSKSSISSSDSSNNISSKIPTLPQGSDKTGSSKTSPLLRVKTNQGQKKNKKKIAPQTISSLLPSALTDGNISRHKSSNTGANDTFSDHFPRLNQPSPSPSHSASMGILNTFSSNSDSNHQVLSQWPSLGGSVLLKKNSSTAAATTSGTATETVKEASERNDAGGGRDGKQKKKRAVLLQCDNTASLGGNIAASAWASNNNTSCSISSNKSDYNISDGNNLNDNSSHSSCKIICDNNSTPPLEKERREQQKKQDPPPSLDETFSMHTLTPQAPTISNKEDVFTKQEDMGNAEGDLLLALPPPVLCHQISHSVQSQLDTLGVTVTVTTVDVPTTLVSTVSNVPQTHASLSALEALSADEPASMQAAHRMGEIYGHVILRYHSEYFPVTPCIIFLTKLLSVRYVHVGKQIKLLLKDLKRFPTCLLNNARLERFAIGVISTILPLLQSIGGYVLNALTEILVPIEPPLVRRINACSKAAQVTMMITSQQQSEEEKLLSTSNVEAFIRPFDEDSDNRNEYKTQIEKNIYNERERCFDEFSNLFRQFQEVNRSDLDGSKINEFWSNLYARGTKVLNLNDCNYLWFANIFKDMLLFHGTNLPKGSSAFSYLSESPGNVSTPQGKTIDNKLLSPQSAIVTPSHSSSLCSSSVKQRHLEERLGQGGGAKTYSTRRAGGSEGHTVTPSSVSSARNSYSHSSSKQSTSANSNSGNLCISSQRTKNLGEAIHDPSTHFPGNQLFFFRFILVMDCNRFNVILQDILLTEVLHLLDISLQTYQELRLQSSSACTVGSSSRDNSGGVAPCGTSNISEEYQCSSQNQNKDTKSFTLRVLKLRVLGKFQGLLHFSPFWNISVHGLKDSPLAASAQTYAKERSFLNGNSGMPLFELLHYSGAEIHSSLSLTVPWVTSYLKMLSWDSTSVLSMTKKELQLLLQHHSSLSQATTLINSDTQYIHCIALFHLILTSDIFDLKKSGDAAISKNRVSVVFEIQSFLSGFPSLVATYKLFSKLTALPHMPNFLKSSKKLHLTGKDEEAENDEDDMEVIAEEPLGHHNSMLVDDHNTGFSTSFFKYLVPDLFQAITLMRQRFVQFQRSEALVCEQLIASSTLINRPSSLRSSSTKRQAPTLISSHTTLSTHSSSSCGKSTCISTDLFSHNISSPPRHISSPGHLVMSPSHNFDVMRYPPPPPTSPLLNSKGQPGRLSNGGGRGTQSMFSFTPPQLKSGTGPMSRMLRDSDSSEGGLAPTALFRSSSADSRSMSIGSNPDSSEYFSVTQHEEDENIQKVLEMSFWNQHPHLHSISNFVVEHVNQACRQRLKERVADLVLQAWACCDIAGSHCLSLAKTGVMTATTTISAAITSPGDVTNLLVAKYQTLLEKQTSALFRSMCSETEDFLNASVGDHILSTITPFLTVYALSEGVKETVVKIAMRQQYSLTKSLYTFYCVYARKKLSEVCSKSIPQQKKFFADFENLGIVQSTTAEPRHEPSGEDITSAANVVIHTLGDSAVNFKTLRECLYNICKPMQDEQTSFYSVQLSYNSESSGSSGVNDDCNFMERIKYTVIRTEQDKLMELFFSHHVIVHFIYTGKNLVMDNSVLSCNTHKSAFRYFSAYMCGMVAKCTVLCGQMAMRVFVTSPDGGRQGGGLCDKEVAERQTVSIENGCEASSVEPVSSMLVMIRNILSVQSQLLAWASEQLTVFGTTCQCTGRLKIDVMKMLTSTISSLFLFDIFLERYSSPTLVGTSFTSGSIIVTRALHCKLINLDNIAQLIGYSLKHSLLTTVFSLLRRTNEYKAAIVTFVGQLLAEKSREERMDLDIDVGVGSWANDPAVRRIIKADISIELANVIETLIKK